MVKSPIMLGHGSGPDHYISIVRVSPFNLPDERRRYVVIKAYFDGSWQDARTLTLGGFSGSADGWSAFLPQWRRVLDENGIEHWHSTDAMRCAGYYKKVVLGWDAARAVAVRDSLLRVIMRCGSYRLPVEERLRGFAATVYLADYHRVRAELPELRSPYAMCVNSCVGPAIPNDAPDGSVILYFDQNERFMREIHQVWQKGLAKRNTRQRKWAVKVATISELDSRRFPELQAADLMAGLINKYDTLRLTAGDSDNVSRYVKKIRWQIRRLRLAIEPEYNLLDYERIRADYPAEYERHRRSMHLKAFGTKKQRELLKPEPPND